MRHRAYISVIILAVISSLAAHADPVDVRHYIAKRKSLQASASLNEVKSDPASCAGKSYEIRGKLVGSLKNGNSGSVIVTTADNGSFVLSINKLPDDNPGVEIACLASALKNGELIVQAWTYDIELKRHEKSLRPRRQTQQPAASKNNPARKTAASRDKASPTLTAEQLIQIYTKAVKQFNPKLTNKQADMIARSILGFSFHYKVDARLVCAVILAESHFKVGATSKCGAMGLGQLMPTTAAGLGVNNAYDPVENIYGSTRYIKSMLDRVTGNKHCDDLTWNDIALALAAYNAGPGAVKKHSGIPPYKETINYVRKVTQIYKQLCGVK